MPQIVNGTFADGPNKGHKWQAYEDPASQTGWTRKSWNPYDTSNSGQPTEYFEPFDAASADVDEQAAQQAAAGKAADAAQQTARQAGQDQKASAFWTGVQQTNNRTYQEGVRQFDVGNQNTVASHNLAVQAEKDRASEAKRANDLSQVDTRTRLQLGLAQLAHDDRSTDLTDQRARETNVMDYLKTISSLRLPYSELQSLSQRAVAGIIPGAAAPTPAAGATNAAAAAAAGASGGALTADQWAALSQGLNRQWEQNQIGQGSATQA